MIIEFPGTRGEIEETSSIHRYHSSLIISYKNTSLLIDLGVKHNPRLSDRFEKIDFLLITHAHPDHYIWTVENRENIKIPVYLTGEAFNYGKYKPSNYTIIENNKVFRPGDFIVTAYRVIHSLRCPAVAFKITGDKTIIYAPDIVDFYEDKGKILNNTDVLIADGSSLNINMVRRRDDKIFGHTRVKTIIGWCKKYGINQLIITHCGKQIVTMDENKLREKIEEYSDNKVDVRIAYDGRKLKL